MDGVGGPLALVLAAIPLLGAILMFAYPVWGTAVVGIAVLYLGLFGIGLSAPGAIIATGGLILLALAAHQFGSRRN